MLSDSVGTHLLGSGDLALVSAVFGPDDSVQVEPRRPRLATVFLTAAKACHSLTGKTEHCLDAFPMPWVGHQTSIKVTGYRLHAALNGPDVSRGAGHLRNARDLRDKAGMLASETAGPFLFRSVDQGRGNWHLIVLRTARLREIR